MDSFEWFGEIGNQQFDSLKPPGDMFHETLNTATMGLESFGGGGGGGGGSDKQYEAMKEQQEIQDKANEQAWNYEWDQVQRSHKDTLVRNMLTRKQNEEALLYKEATAKQNWQYQMGIRQHQYNAAVAQFNKSEKLYRAQVNYNQVAARLAAESAGAVRQERLTDLMYQGMGAALKYSAKKSELGTARAKADIQIVGKGIEADQEKQRLTLENQAKRAEAAFSAQSNLTKTIQQRGQVASRGQVGRSAEKTYQAMIADYGRASAQLADQVNRSDSSYNLAMVGIDKSLDLARATYGVTRAEITAQSQYASSEYELGLRQRESTRLSIGKSYDRELEKIKHDQYGANLRADAQRMSVPTMPPPIPKPLELPRTQILDPPTPVRPPKPLEGQGSPTPYRSGAGQSSGGGMFGAIGGAVGALGTAGGIFGPLGAGVGMAVGGVIDAIF